MSQILILSPLSQFEVTSLIGLNAPIFGYLNITLTNLGLYASFILLVVIGLHFYGNNDFNLIPNKWSISLESSYASLNSMVREQIGNNNEIYLPSIYSLFFFILFGNLISNVPYSFAITSSVIVAIGFSVTIFLGVTILGLYTHKLHFFSFFIPSGTPLAMVPLLSLIEIVSYLARAITLGIRLFANLVAGHSLLKILSTFLLKFFNNGLFSSLISLVPFSIFVALSVL